MNVTTMTTGMSVISLGLRGAIQYVEHELKAYSPVMIGLAASAITLLAVKIFSNRNQVQWGETKREQYGNLALRSSYVKKLYKKDIDKELLHFKESVRKKWKAFGKPMTAIPEAGWSPKKLHDLVDAYSKATADPLKGQHLSGTIYSKGLDRGYVELSKTPFDINLQPEKTGDTFFFGALSKKLKDIFTYAFSHSYLWNSLHADEFGVGAFIDYQVVRMVASMFGGSANEVMGFVTSGGTESLMLAVRSYRDWGIKNRGHKPGESIVIAPKSVHASILKSSQAYHVNIVLVDTDEAGRVDLKHLQHLVNEHGKKVVAVIGSAPSYPTGVIDPIAEMAKIAQKNGCGMHVDCCLGAFILNNLPGNDTEFLKMPGVTSLSADTHKNGLAPKGSSVVVTKNLGEENLAYYSIYAMPEWSGGVYGTPKDNGSQPVTQSLNALLAILGTGKNGYQKIAKSVHSATMSLANEISKYDKYLTLLSIPEVNVVAFKINPSWGLEKGATYAFAHEMKKRNFVLNTLSNDTVHFCVTTRFASDLKAIQLFTEAVAQSLEAVRVLNYELKKNKQKFPGDAGMYCALEAAMTPDSQQMSVSKYIQNVLLGRQGAKDTVRAYFLALLNPFAPKEFPL